MEALQKKLAEQFMGVIFFIMGQVGCLMIILGTFKPMFHLYIWPGTAALLCTIVWSLWRGRSKGVSWILVLIPLGVSLWIVLSGLLGLVHPPAVEVLQTEIGAIAGAIATSGDPAGAGAAAGVVGPALAELVQHGIVPLAGVLIAATGAAILLIASLMGIMAVREME